MSSVETKNGLNLLAIICNTIPLPNASFMSSIHKLLFLTPHISINWGLLPNMQDTTQLPVALTLQHTPNNVMTVFSVISVS